MGKKILLAIEKYEKHIALASGISLAVLLRINVLHFRSKDMIEFWEPWYDFIDQHGGFAALKYNFYNYNPPYMYVLALATYLPSAIPKWVTIKLFTIPFDFICAYLAYKIAKLRYPTGRMPIVALLGVLLAPTVFLNSSMWGQVDMLYTCAMVGCLYFILIGREIPAFVCFGVAFAFKLQSMFLAPFLFIMLLKGQVSWKSFFIIPVIYVIGLLPAYFAGRSFADLMLVYMNQAGYYQALTKASPNLYAWIPNTLYSVMVPVGLLVTTIIVLFISFSVYTNRIRMTHSFVVQTALLSVLLVPFLLPKMHDRYFFPADVISIIYAVYFPRLFFVPIAVIFASLFSYLSYLTRVPVVGLRAASLVMTAAVAVVIYQYFKTLWLEKSEVPEEPELANR